MVSGVVAAFSQFDSANYNGFRYNMLKDARNDLARPLVWQTLCQLLQEKKISTINFVPILKCCLQTSAFLCFSFTSSRWLSRSAVGPSGHRVPVLFLFRSLISHSAMLSQRISQRLPSLLPTPSSPGSRTCLRSTNAGSRASTCFAPSRTEASRWVPSSPSLRSTVFSAACFAKATRFPPEWLC